MKKISLVLLAFLIFAGFNGCSSSEEGETDMDRAKTFLSNGEYNYADEYFQKVLQDDPNNGEALIGSAVSQFLALTIDIANYVATIAGINRSDNIPTGGFDIMDGTKTEKEDILQVVKDIFGGFMVRWERMERTLDLAKIRGTHLKIDRLPVNWNLSTIMDWGGVIDRTDVYFLSAFSKLFLGTVKFLLSQELDIDVFQIYAQYNHLQSITINGNPVPTSLLVMNILTLILNDPELNFLGLSTWDLNDNGVEDGREFYTSAVSYFTGAYSDFMSGIELGLKEPLDTRNLFMVIDASKASQWELDDSKYVKDLFSEYGLKYDVILYNRFYYGTATASVHFMFDQKTLDSLSNINKNLKYHSPKLVDLKTDITPILASVLATLLKLNQDVGFYEFSGTLGFFLNSLVISPSSLDGLLEGFIPDFIAFDFHDFFSNPVSFRTLLPPWRSDLDKDENMFFLEWDTTVPYEPGVLSNYPLRGPWGIILPADQTPEDVDHFTAGVYYLPQYRTYGIKRITKDYIASPLPYISFRNNDASFNGLLYLSFGNDPSALNGILDLNQYYSSSSYPTEFSPATARDFNTLVGVIYKKLEKYIDSYLYGE